MGKPSTRKRQKALARKKTKAEQKRVAEARRRYAETFPEVVYEENGAPPQLVKLIKDTIRTINFQDRREFQAWETEFFKMLKEAGSDLLYELYQSDGDHRLLALHILTRLHRLVMSRVDQEQLRRWCPYHAVEILPVGPRILVTFDSLASEPGRNGTIFFSRFRPTLEIDGQRKVVGFFRHAIQRICSRAVSAVDPAVVLNCAFSIVGGCVHFDRADLCDGQLAFSLFLPCMDDSFNGVFAKAVLGELFRPDASYYYRLGYCPAVMERGFIVAKTLLFPGYDATPEWRLVWNTDITFDRRKRINQRIQAFEGLTEWSEDDLEHFKFFHEQGIPQVIETDAELYKWFVRP